MAKKTINKTKPKTVKKRPSTRLAAPRKLAMPQYRSFRLHARVKHPKRLQGSAKLFRASIRLLLKNWKLFGSLILIYIILDLVFVKGFTSTGHIVQLKQAFQIFFGTSSTDISTNVRLFSQLLQDAGRTQSELANAYQSILLVVMSLVVIWTLRQVLTEQKVGVRDAFYKSLYPIVPFILVLTVIALQLLPLAIARGLYQFVFEGGLAVSWPEQLLWAAAIFLISLFSIYMISSSIFALYIVTLPDIRPMQALRSARELVRFRRWAVMRKVLFLPFVMLLIAAVIMIPILLFLTPIAEWLFFVLTMVALVVMHSYLYNLYRELL